MDERKLIIIIMIVFMISQFIIFGTLFFAGLFRFEVSTPESSKIFDVHTVLENKREVRLDSILAKNYYMYEALKRQQKLLEAKQESLIVYENRIKMLEKEIQKRKAEIEKTKKEIENLVLENKKLEAKKETILDKKYKRLAKIYANIEPQQAARYLEAMDSKTAIEILIRMNPENAGAIMKYLKDTKKGIEITKAALKGLIKKN